MIKGCFWSHCSENNFENAFFYLLWSENGNMYAGVEYVGSHYAGKNVTLVLIKCNFSDCV